MDPQISSADSSDREGVSLSEELQVSLNASLTLSRIPLKMLMTLHKP